MSSFNAKKNKYVDYYPKEETNITEKQDTAAVDDIIKNYKINKQKSLLNSSNMLPSTSRTVSMSTSTYEASKLSKNHSQTVNWELNSNESADSAFFESNEMSNLKHLLENIMSKSFLSDTKSESVDTVLNESGLESLKQSNRKKADFEKETLMLKCKLAMSLDKEMAYEKMIRTKDNQIENLNSQLLEIELSLSQKER
jgi:hypothetical protein